MAEHRKPPTSSSARFLRRLGGKEREKMRFLVPCVYAILFENYLAVADLNARNTQRALGEVAGIPATELLKILRGVTEDGTGIRITHLFEAILTDPHLVYFAPHRIGCTEKYFSVKPEEIETVRAAISEWFAQYKAAQPVPAPLAALMERLAIP